MVRSSMAVVVLVLCFMFMSCDLFKTRTPEEPSQQSSNNIQLSDPSKVLENMVNAFQDGNSVNYAKSFSDISFTFEASANAQGKYGGDLTTWDKSKEQKYFERVLNHFSSTSAKVVLVFEPYTPTYYNNTSQVETAYHLTLPMDAGVVKKFNGKVQYTLSQDPSGFWSINQWVDVGSDSTWSDLKGIAYSQWY